MSDFSPSLWPTHIGVKTSASPVILIWSVFIDNLFNITNTVMSQGQKSRKYVTWQLLSRPFLTVNSVVFCPTSKVLEDISMLVMIWIAWIKEHHIHPCQALPSIWTVSLPKVPKRRKLTEIIRCITFKVHIMTESSAYHWYQIQPGKPLSQNVNGHIKIKGVMIRLEAEPYLIWTFLVPVNSQRWHGIFRQTTKKCV